MPEPGPEYSRVTGGDQESGVSSGEQSPAHKLQVSGQRKKTDLDYHFHIQRIQFKCFSFEKVSIDNVCSNGYAVRRYKLDIILEPCCINLHGISQKHLRENYSDVKILLPNQGTKKR